MTKPWHVERPKDLEAMTAALRSAYPTLHVFANDAEVTIRGGFPVMDKGVVLDRYKIEIKLPDNYPRALPAISEIGGRIPRMADRHVNERDGALCVGLPDALWAHRFGTGSVVEFLDGPVRNYFLGNIVFERDGRWPFGELGHGGSGVFEYYRDVFATENAVAILQLLSCLQRSQPKWQRACPCGSGRKLSICHGDTIRQLSGKIPTDVLRASMKGICDLFV